MNQEEKENYPTEKPARGDQNFIAGNQNSPLIY